MADIIKEKYLEKYPKPFSLKSTEKIIEQMRNNVCKIYLLDGTKGTGFFCKIPYDKKNNLLTVLISNNHVINDDILKKKEKILISINNTKKELELQNRIIYSNKEYDITIIEIKEKSDKINNYLELDYNLNDNMSNIDYVKESIYLIQYEGAKTEVSVSYGILNGIDELNRYTFRHLCSTEKGSSGSPILNPKTNKIIGIHKAADKYDNRGTFLNYAIKDFITKMNNTELIKKFKEKYKLNKIDNDNTKLFLKKRNLGNEGLKFLCEIELKQLKELYLYDNNISEINILKNAKFEQLEILSLAYNKITDINVLEEVNFNKLRELYLQNNYISDIKILEKVKFEQLDTLNLSYNKISDIDVLEKVKFKNLKKLELNNNKISEIQIFEKELFKQLEKLNLEKNEISYNKYSFIIDNLKFKIKDFNI